jgi:hypothetical protein
MTDGTDRKGGANAHRDVSPGPVAEAVDVLTQPLPKNEPDRSREAAQRAEIAARVLAAAAG